jgi:hypothetical protein
MKRNIQISSGVFFLLVIIFMGCKKDEELTPILPSPPRFNTTSFDSTMFVMHDTMYAPANDKGSKTFFNSETLMVLTAQQINAAISLSNGVIFGYFYSSDSSRAVIANTYAYFDTAQTSGWNKKATIFRKNVPLASYTSVGTANDILNAWNAATPYSGANSGGNIYKLSEDQVFAYNTEEGKVGLIRIIFLKPGNNPYTDYIVFEIKMQK